MIAETVYPIVQTLPRAEKLKLFARLEKELQGIIPVRKIDWREQRVREMQKRFEAKLYPPK